MDGLLAAVAGRQAVAAVRLLIGRPHRLAPPVDDCEEIMLEHGAPPERDVV
jgi:hypothetical protein